jgi:exodeoxyribonuclease VII large subunit
VKVVADAGHRVDMTGHRLKQAASLALRIFTERAEGRSQMLKLLGPEGILSRGFSYTTEANGRVLMNAEDVKPGGAITTRLAKGSVRSVVKE